MHRRPDVAAGPRWRTAAVVLAAGLVLALSGLGVMAVATQRGYSEDSPEVGFTRDMYVHHDQAVVMSLLVRERGSDPEVAAMARDMVTGQAEQQGVMLAWLHEHDVPVSTSVAPMSWVPETAEGGHDMSGMAGMAAAGTTGSAAGGAEPAAAEAAADAAPDDADAAAGTAGEEDWRAEMGMASDDDLSRLGRLSGIDADLLFVQLMQRHHRGAVAMAQTFDELSDEPQLAWLTDGILAAQQRELRILAEMEQRLTAAGATTS